MREKIIRVPISAQTTENAYKGIPVKEAYWTAGFQEGSDIRNVAPLNHGETYVIPGESLGLPKDILVRTGNALINLDPEARSIAKAETQVPFRVFHTDDLNGADEIRLLTSLGTLEDHQKLKGIGTKLHFDRMEAIRKAFEELS